MSHDISLVSTEDLMEEILKRVDAAILMTYQINLKPGENQVLWRYTGGSIICMGLTQHMQNRLAEDLPDPVED